MASLFRRGTEGLRTLALVALCAWATTAAEGPPAAAVPAPPLLSTKTASKLVAKKIKPDYPLVAKLNYIQGSVHLQLTVTPEGQLTQAHVLRGHPLLASAALAAVRHWQYRPLQTRSGPSAFRTIVKVVFSLHVRKLRPFPSRPEEDFRRQVRPPEVAEGPGRARNNAFVRMRVLVSEAGLVLDSHPLAGNAAHFEAAQEIVQHWTFRPARWGSIAVPWYLEVDVPIEDWAARGSPASAEN